MRSRPAARSRGPGSTSAAAGRAPRPAGARAPRPGGSAATVRSLPENSLTKRSGSGMARRARSPPAAGPPPSPPCARGAAPPPRPRAGSPSACEQRARLLEREAQVGAADLDQIARQAQAMEAELAGPRASTAPRAASPGRGRGSAPAAAAPPASAARGGRRSPARRGCVERPRGRTAAARPCRRRGRPGSAPTRSTGPSSAPRRPARRSGTARTAARPARRARPRPRPPDRSRRGPHPRPQQHRLAAAGRGAEQDHLAALAPERASKSARRGTSRSMAGSRSAGTGVARPRRCMTARRCPHAEPNGRGSGRPVRLVGRPRRAAGGCRAGRRSAS